MYLFVFCVMPSLFSLNVIFEQEKCGSEERTYLYSRPYFNINNTLLKIIIYFFNV